MGKDLQPSGGSAYAWVVVAILSFGAIVSFVDRQIINLLVEPIKADFGLSDTQIGLLQGLSFVLFYALFGLPLARLADGGNRTRMILCGVICWSMATFACGLSTTFAALFVARMFVGVGEATLTPAGYSIISDYFPPSRVALAISIFTGANFVGAGLAYVVGGAIIGHFNALGTVVVPLLGPMKPWQMAFVIAALPGALLALLVLIIKEPPRQGESPGLQRFKPTMKTAFDHVGSNFRVFLPLMLGLSFVAAGNFAINVWAPTYFIRVFAMNPRDVGSMFGSILAIASAGGVFAGGAIASILMRRGWVAANIAVPIGAVVIALPFILSLTFAQTADATLARLAPVLFFAAVPFGCGTAALPLISPNRVRAQIIAVYLLVANLVGFTCGPAAVGVLTDYVFADLSKIGYSISIAVSGFYLIGILLLATALPHYKRMLAKFTIATWAK